MDFERLDFGSRTAIHPSRGSLILCPPRSAGVHLSSVLYYCAVHMNLLKDVDDFAEGSLPLRMAMGVSWEEFLFSFHPEWLWQPGEQQEPSSLVWGTPDGICSPSPGRLYLVETKLTWKKVKTAHEFLQAQWMWLHQGRFYCSLYDCFVVEWHVNYVNGDYRRSGPVYMKYTIEFDRSEVDSTVRMIGSNRDRAAAWEKDKG